jgi:hypothetical protein
MRATFLSHHKLTTTSSINVERLNTPVEKCVNGRISGQAQQQLTSNTSCNAMPTCVHEGTMHAPTCCVLRMCVCVRTCPTSR